jgi:hypothetical protein
LPEGPGGPGGPIGSGVDALLWSSACSSSIAALLRIARFWPDDPERSAMPMPTDPTISTTTAAMTMQIVDAVISFFGRFGMRPFSSPSTGVCWGNPRMIFFHDLSTTLILWTIAKRGIFRNIENTLHMQLIG